MLGKMFVVAVTVFRRNSANLIVQDVEGGSGDLDRSLPPAFHTTSSIRPHATSTQIDCAILLVTSFSLCSVFY